MTHKNKTGPLKKQKRAEESGHKYDNPRLRERKKRLNKNEQKKREKTSF